MEPERGRLADSGFTQALPGGFWSPSAAEVVIKLLATPTGGLVQRFFPARAPRVKRCYRGGSQAQNLRGSAPVVAAVGVSAPPGFVNGLTGVPLLFTGELPPLGPDPVLAQAPDHSNSVSEAKSRRVKERWGILITA